jgi:hypothetical protein
LATVDCATSIPSLSSSPWMRGAPQSRLAKLISRIRRRISPDILGRPPRLRDFQRQYSRKPFRCHRMTVSGWTIVTASNTDGNRRYSQTKSNRSASVSFGLEGTRWRNTPNWCRSRTISASSCPCVLNGETRTCRKPDHGSSAYLNSALTPVRIEFSVRKTSRRVIAPVSR